MFNGTEFLPRFRVYAFTDLRLLLRVSCPNQRKSNLYALGTDVKLS